MKILLTGASGFIGRHVLREIAATGHTIVATGLEPRPVGFDLPQGPNVSYISCDLNEEKKDYYQFFGAPDSIIHLSWQGLPNYRDLFHIENNLPMNCRFIKNCVQNGLRDITILGTCLEYGIQFGPLSEEMTVKPSVSYAIAKDALRRYIEELQKSFTFNFKWLRLFYTYGPGQNKSSILEQLQRALDAGEKIFDMSKGDQLRDYLPIETVAKYIVSISLQQKVQGIINCCSGNPISIRELVESYMRTHNCIIQLNLGARPYPDYEAMAFWGDTTKLQSAIGTGREHTREKDD